MKNLAITLLIAGSFVLPTSYASTKGDKITETVQVTETETEIEATVPAKHHAKKHHAKKHHAKHHGKKHHAKKHHHKHHEGCSEPKCDTGSTCN